MNKKMKLRSGSRIGGNVGGGGGSFSEDMSPNPQQSASALNSADVRVIKEQLDVIKEQLDVIKEKLDVIEGLGKDRLAKEREMKEQLDVIKEKLDVIEGLGKDRLAKERKMKEQLDVIIGHVKDWLAKDQEKKLSAIEQQVKERRAFKDRVELIKMMKERNLEFVGTCDPMEVEDWIMEMEKHFSLFGTTDKDKVTIAAFMLKDGAHYWWESLRSSHPETAGPITWQTFKDAFYDRYLHWNLRLLKEREFAHLQQGDRTVAEYALEFSRLARFAPQLVRDEYSRASRFIRGLRSEIMLQVWALNPKTLLDALNRSLLVESANNKCEEEAQAPNKRRNRKRGRYNNSHFGGWHNNSLPQM